LNYAYQGIAQILGFDPRSGDRNGSHAVTLVITFHLLELGFAPWLDAAVDDNRQPIRHI
jgi:hypothetical protein